jgi:hypothetical protein
MSMLSYMATATATAVIQNQNRLKSAIIQDLLGESTRLKKACVSAKRRKLCKREEVISTMNNLGGVSYYFNYLVLKVSINIYDVLYYWYF